MASDANLQKQNSRESKLKTLFVILTLIAFPMTVFGQSAFLEKGQSGFGIGADFLTNKDATGFGGSAGYSFSGIFDFGVSVHHSDFEDGSWGKDLSAVSVIPAVSFCVLKQSSDITPSFSLDVGYEFRKYSSERLSYSNATLTDHFLLLGASLFGYNRLNHYTKIQPAMSVSFIIDNTRLKYKYNNEVESGYHYTYAYGVGLSLIFDVSPKNAFVITPAISIVKNKISFGFELASVFATKESDMMLR